MRQDLASDDADWERVTLGAVVKQVKDRVQDPVAAGLTHYVPGGGISSDDFRISDFQPVDDGVMGPAFNMRFLPGHTLYKSRVPHGVAVADRPGICANTTFVLAPKDTSQLDPCFLPYLLVSRQFRGFEDENNHGSTNLFLNFSDIRRFEFSLPPLEYQHKALRLLRAATELERSWQRLASLAHAGRDAMLSEYLRQVLGTDRPLSFAVSSREQSVELRRAGDLLKARQGLQVARRSRFPEPGEGRLPYLTMQYLLHGGELEYVVPSSSRVICTPADVLVARTGMTNGTVFTGVSGAFHNNFFAVDYDDAVIRRDFLVAYLQHPQVRHLMRGLSGATNIPDLNHGDFYAIPIPLPTIDEQDKFCEAFSLAARAAASADTRAGAAARLKELLVERVLGGPT